MKKYVVMFAVIAGLTAIAPQVEAIAGKVIRSKSYSYSAASSVSGVRGDVPVIDGDNEGGNCNGVSAASCDASQTLTRTRSRTRKVKAPRMRVRASYEGCDMSQTGVSAGIKVAPPAVAAPPIEGAPEPPK